MKLSYLILLLFSLVLTACGQTGALSLPPPPPPPPSTPPPQVLP